MKIDAKFLLKFFIGNYFISFIAMFIVMYIVFVMQGMQKTGFTFLREAHYINHVDKSLIIEMLKMTALLSLINATIAVAGIYVKSNHSKKPNVD